jgi:hypothetical protein
MIVKTYVLYHISNRSRKPFTAEDVEAAEKTEEYPRSVEVPAGSLACDAKRTFGMTSGSSCGNVPATLGNV